MDPNDILRLFGVEQDPVTQNLPVNPTVQTPQPAAPAVPPAAQSMSGKFSGVTDEGIKQAGKVYSPTDKRIAAQTAPLQAAANADLAKFGAAKEQLQSSYSEQARLTQQHQTEMARLKLEEAAFHQDAASLEARIHDETKAQSEAYLSQYRQQIAAVRAMSVDPTGPIGSLSTAQAGGLSMAMFAQGFLAAQGIHIDVGGQIDRWVERSIHEQERKIQQAEKGAQDTLNLWDLAKQSSRDDFEARQRYRGFVVAGMMATTEAKAAQFQSSIAAAKAQEANAKLAIELGATERAIRDGYFNKEHAVRQAEYQRAYQMGSLAQQSKQIAETERHNKALEAAKGGDSGFVPVKHPGKLVRDANGKVVGAKVEYMLDPKVANDKTKMIGQQYSEFRQGIQKLRELRQPAMDDFIELGPAKAASMFSEENRRYQRNKAMIGEQLINVLTGAAAPKEQMDRIFGVLADDKLFQKGGNSSGLDDLEHWFATKFESAMNYDPGVRRIGDDELKMMTAAGKDYLPISQDENESSDIVNARKEAGKPLADGLASKEYMRATNVDSQDVISRAGGHGYAATPDGQVTTPYWDFASKTRTDEPYKEEHRHMETLAHMIAQPEIFTTPEENAEEIRNEATAALARLSNEDKYAGYLYSIAKTDPGALAELLLPAATKPVAVPEALRLKSSDEFNTE